MDLEPVLDHTTADVECNMHDDAYDEAKKERKRAYNKAYKENHKERLKAETKAYYENNKEYLKFKSHWNQYHQNYFC